MTRILSSLPENTRGALIMTLSMAAFTTNDSFMKAVLADLPLFQALFLRASLNIVMVLLILVPIIGPVRFDLSKRDWMFVFVRSFAEVLAAMAFLTAVSHMPLANATAIMQTMPLSITIAGFLLFRDPLGWRRLVAIFIGFAGVMLIVQPGREGFSGYAFFAIFAMLCVTVRDISVRKMSATVPTTTVTLGAVFGVWLVTGLASIGVDWKPVSLTHWGQLFGSGICLVVGYVTSVTVMRVGEMSFVSPFRYTALVWALLIGFFAFGEWPNAMALTGAFVIAGTGVYTVWREAQLRRRALRAAQG
ncbi:DMT family transporter [Celeribacter litoreus]|uniref:DMT family transporter n=1 Tax=Celeribacter litoreus TaxID=2876714 RepID=UPI001CCD4E45|nr:DMT family transporter [Celeribacter litoreus]MCA0042407.1 DMT family transporter [Celeribacter litoreus]